MTTACAAMRRESLCVPDGADRGGREPFLRGSGQARSFDEEADTLARLAAGRRLLEEYESRQERRRPGRRSRLAGTGLAELDEALGGGVPAGVVCEIASAAEGVGALSLALRMAQAARLRRGEHRCMFLIDPRGDFYPPAAAQTGIALERLVVVRLASRAEAIWAMDQALRCGSVGAVVGLFGLADERASRRLQLAAEAGGGIGLLVRGADEGPPAKFAALRMLVEATNQKRDVGTKGRRDEGLALSREGTATSRRQGDTSTQGGGWGVSRRVRVQLLKARPWMKAASIVVELSDAAGDVHPSAVSGDRPGDTRRWAAG